MKPFNLQPANICRYLVILALSFNFYACSGDDIIAPQFDAMPENFSEQHLSESQLRLASEGLESATGIRNLRDMISLRISNANNNTIHFRRGVNGYRDQVNVSYGKPQVFLNFYSKGLLTEEYTWTLRPTEGIPMEKEVQNPRFKLQAYGSYIVELSVFRGKQVRGKYTAEISFHP